MKNKILLYIMYGYIILLVCGCAKKVYVPVEKVTTVTVTHRDTVIQFKPEKENVYIQSRDTAVYAETKYAVAEASWSGEEELLSLTLRNRNVEIPIEVQYVEIIRVDSIPRPYPVEVIKKERFVPWYTKALSAMGVATLLSIVFLIVRKRWLI